MFIAEAGYAPVGLEATLRILKINTNGEITSFADREIHSTLLQILYFMMENYMFQIEQRYQL